MTNALCKESSSEVRAWAHVVELAISIDVPLIPVISQVELSENIRRSIQQPDVPGLLLPDTSPSLNNVPRSTETWRPMDSFHFFSFRSILSYLWSAPEGCLAGSPEGTALAQKPVVAPNFIVQNSAAIVLSDSPRDGIRPGTN
jgi:hypothetical protein